MSEKRRDNKNRILRNGESQRKDGRYAFKYSDANGKAQFVYSWKLESTDKLPAGKRDCLSLREKEKQILNTARKLFERFGIETDYKCLYTHKNYAFYRIENDMIKVIRILSTKATISKTLWKNSMPNVPTTTLGIRNRYQTQPLSYPTVPTPRLLSMPTML